MRDKLLQPAVGGVDAHTYVLAMQHHIYTLLVATVAAAAVSAQTAPTPETLGDGCGATAPTFPTQPVSTATANGPSSVYAADVDGDGDIDVVSASAIDDKIAWYENTDGLGTFGAQQVISTSANDAYNVHLADVDGDGDIDVLSASRFDDKIAWYENLSAPTPETLGDGCGATAPTFPTQSVISTNADGAWSVIAADVDGDGDIDVLSASGTDNKIAWYANTDGLGTFGAQQVISTNANGARSVRAADIDGDGDIDVLSASLVDAKIAWYENTDGQGTFGSQQIISINANGAQSVHAADVDGDGDVDVLCACHYTTFFTSINKFAWYENIDGLGTFGAQQVISTTALGSKTVFTADVDGDGDLDVLSASQYDDKIGWYENTDGQGSFGSQLTISASADAAQSVHAADVDGDGDVDVLSASLFDDKIAWYENTDGQGTFGPEQVLSTNADGAQSVYAADVDGDGDIDVLSASRFDDKIAWHENTDGLGTFGPEQVLSTNADSAGSVYAADVDGDGDIDILSASALDNKIAWYENDGAGPLSLSADSLVIDSTWELEAENVQGSVAVFFFGDTAWNLPLDVLGAPGCTSYTNGNFGAFVQLASNGTSTMSLAVPNNPALVGFELTAQSTCAGSNALGFLTSNGLRATAGY